MDNPKKSIAQALADLESEKARQAQWKRDHAKELDEAAAQRAETDSKLAALSQADRRRVLDAAGLQHVSAAPAPLKPLRSSAPMPTRPTPQEPPPIDWAFWRAMRTVKLWQGCALVVGLDPDGLKHHPQGWMAGPGSGPVFDSRSFPNAQAKDRLDKAMRLAETAASYMEGPIFPRGTPSPGSKRDKDVALSEVVAFFRSCEWPDIPDQLKSISAPEAVSKPQAPALVPAGAADSGKPAPTNGKRWTPEMLAKLEAYRQCHTMPETAEEFGITEQRIRHLLPSKKPKATPFGELIHRPK